ncbi:retrotransposon-related protein [Tanacetum coccineum]
MRDCQTCQRYKPNLEAYPGLLQPLPIPISIWTSISMDFIKGLPKSQGKDVILVVVDRLSKYSHFMALSHPFTASQVAQLFLYNIFKLHGLPENIMLDRDKIFKDNHFVYVLQNMSAKYVTSLCSTKYVTEILEYMDAYDNDASESLQPSWGKIVYVGEVGYSTSHSMVCVKYSAYVRRIVADLGHVPTNEYSPRPNDKCLECYLRCMTGEQLKQWFKWLSLAEWWDNTNFHTSIHTTPYEAVYRKPPPVHILYVRGESKVDLVDKTLSGREAAVETLKFHISIAQSRIKPHANKGRTDKKFDCGDWVFLKLQPYRQVSLRQGKQNKFSPKFFGPFKVIQRIGQVAYKLELPTNSQIHNVFHVSQLKKYRHPNHNRVCGTLPPCDNSGVFLIEPVAILDKRMAKKGNGVEVYVLVQWANGTSEDATWESVTDLQAKFPCFDYTT